MNKKSFLKGFIIISMIMALLWFNQAKLQITPGEIRSWILSFGWFAPIIYILLCTFRPMVLFPASILSIAGGLAFGAFGGFAYTLVGATLGALLSFNVARKLGKNIAWKKWTGKAQQIEEQLESKGFFYVLTLRLIPIINFDMISYLAGISKVRFKAFFFGTLFGIIPGTFVYNFLGASLVDGDIATVLAAVSLFLFFLFVPIFFQEKNQ